MDIPDEMVLDAAERLQKENPTLDELEARDYAKQALDGALGNVSPLSLFFLGPFIKNSNLVFLLNKDRMGGRLMRPIPGSDNKVETVGGYTIDISFADDDQECVTALRILKIPPRTTIEE